MRRASASSAFSTSSFTTEAGRSTTSPAAIWLARSSGSLTMRGAPLTTSPERRNHANIAAEAVAMNPTTHQNCIDSPPGRCGKRHVHAVHAGEHGEGAEQRGHHGNQLRGLRQLNRDAGQMGVEDAGDAVLEDDGVVGQAHELIVDVAEAVGHFLPDQIELATREPPEHVALGNHDAAQAP